MILVHFCLSWSWILYKTDKDWVAGEGKEWGERLSEKWKKKEEQEIIFVFSSVLHVDNLNLALFSPFFYSPLLRSPLFSTPSLPTSSPLLLSSFHSSGWQWEEDHEGWFKFIFLYEFWWISLLKVPCKSESGWASLTAATQPFKYQLNIKTLQQQQQQGFIP